MPPQLALYLCYGLIWFLLRLDRKRDPEVSKALWIPTIWFLSSATKPLGAWLGAEGTVESGSPWDRVLQLVLFVLGLVILSRRPIDWGSVFAQHITILAIVGYMLISLVWSDLAFIALKRWFREIVAIVMGFVVLSEPSPPAAIKVMLRRSAYILIPLSMVLIKYFPLLGRAYAAWSGELMWIGVASQKNGLGRLCLISSFFLIWELVRNRRRGAPAVVETSILKYATKADVGVLLLALYILRGPEGANSATSIVSLVFGLLMFAGLSWMRRKGMKVKPLACGAAALGMIVYGTMTPMLGGASVGMGNVSASMGRDATLTGRTEIWAGLLPIMWKQPITGVGYGSFWTTETAEQFQVNECHNAYLEVLLELGFIGLFIISMYFVSSAKRAAILINQDFYWGALWICFIFMGLLHNIAESSLHTFTSQLSATLMFLRLALIGKLPDAVIVKSSQAEGDLSNLGEHKLDTPG